MVATGDGELGFDSGEEGGQALHIQMEACSKSMVYSRINPWTDGSQVVVPAGNVEAFPWAFHALGRLIETAAKGFPGQMPEEPYLIDPLISPLQRHEMDEKAPAAALQSLEDGPYFVISSFLDARSLAAADSACQAFRTLNTMSGGPWHHLGTDMFRGLELEDEGLFGREDSEEALVSRTAHPDWRGRFARFRRELPSFRAPFVGPVIEVVEQADEIAYCRCRLRTDSLGLRLDRGAYLEVEVLSNPDNVSLAVVDFEAGGCSSVTFSPDTGAVIRERKVQEAPRKVEGAYIQPLPTITAGQGFEGTMGMYYGGGHLAFFRRHYRSKAENEAPELGSWETTGFVTDLSWADGCRLTPCLAFRNEGHYKVRMVCVGNVPPILPEKNAAAYEDANWSSLDWDATEQDAPEL